jgi:VanZ family protein
MRNRLDFLALTLYCGFIISLSAQTTLPAPNLFENADKLNHFLAYFVMGSLGWRAFPAATQVLLLTDFGFCVRYGLSDERHQSFVAERDSSELD